MSLARRVLFGFGFTETNKPGIEMNPDGSMEVIAVDGTRSALPGGGGGGSVTPPVTFTGTDPDVDQVTIKAAPDQNGDTATYILRIEDSDGNLLAGFDFGGTLDAVQGFRAGSLDPAEPSSHFSNGALGISVYQGDQAMFVQVIDPPAIPFKVNPGASGPAGLVEIGSTHNLQIPLVINSFGGTADAIYYAGPPDYNGEFRVTASGGVIFPSADPHVAGAWWDNAGTLTRSSG